MGKGVVAMSNYITFAELMQFCNFVVALVCLVAALMRNDD